MKKRSVVLLVGLVTVGIWMVMYTVQNWRLPRGPVGPSMATFKVVSYEEHTTYCYERGFAGSVDYVRIIATDTDIRAEFHTEKGWYSLPMDLPALVNRREPFVLRFQHPKNLPLREQTADSVRVRSHVLGVFPIEWAHLGGGVTVPGDIAEVRVQFKGDDFEASVLRTSGMKSFCSAYGGGRPVEIHISPTAFP